MLHSDKHLNLTPACLISTPSLLLDCNHISLNTVHVLGCHLYSPLSTSPVWPHIYSPQPHHNLILRQYLCLIQSLPCEMHMIQHLRLHSCLPPVLISTPLKINTYRQSHCIPPDLMSCIGTKNKQCWPIALNIFIILLKP